MKSSAESGQVLVLTLLLIAILAQATVELLVFLRPKLTLSHYLLRRTSLGSAAATGLDYASVVLRKDRNNSRCDSLEEEWAKTLDYRLPGISVSVEIEDEERRFPISLLLEGARVDTGEAETKEDSRSDTEKKDLKISEAGLAAFEDLLRKAGLPYGWAKEASDSLADWIDGDDQPRSSGAEETYYGILGYRARNYLPQTLGELKFVKGFRPEVISVVFPRLSLFAKRVNLNTASAEVLEVIFGTDESLPVYFLVKSRPFETIEEALKLAQIDPKIYNQLKKRLTVTSSFFQVRSTAVDDSGYRETIYAILERDEKSVRVVYWNHLPSASLPLSGGK